MKKIVLITLVFMLMIPLISGCGDKPVDQKIDLESMELKIINQSSIQEVAYDKEIVNNEAKIFANVKGNFEVQVTFSTPFIGDDIYHEVDLTKAKGVESRVLSDNKLSFTFTNPIYGNEYNIVLKKGTKGKYGTTAKVYNLKIVPTTTNEFLEKPKVYITGDLLSTEVKEESNNPLKLPIGSDGAQVRFEFYRDLEVEEANQFVVAGGASLKVEKNNIILTFEEEDQDKEFNITLKKGLHSTNGLTMKNDVTLNIIPVNSDSINRVMAQYKVYGKDNVYTFENGIPEAKEISEAKKFSNDPKKIEVDFTGDVNKESVEEVIKNNLTRSVKYTTKWENDRKLLIDLDFKEETGPISLPLSKALDSNSYNIINDLNFRVYKTNSLYAYDLDTNTKQLIKTFEEKPLRANYNPFFTNFILLTDGEDNYVYNSEIDSLSYIPSNLGFPSSLGEAPWMIPVQWLSEDTVIYYDQTKDAIMRYSFNQHRLMTVLDTGKLGIHPFYMKVAPGSHRIVIADNQNPDYKIYVYTTDGKKIFEKSGKMKNIRSRQLSNGKEIYYISIGWVNNDTIVYEQKDEETGQYRILETDIVNSKTQVLAEKGIDPLGFPVNLSVLYRKYENEREFYMGYDHNYVLVFPGKKIDIDQLSINYAYLVSNNKLVLKGAENYSVDLILYDLYTKNKQYIGEGDVVGKSKDGSKIIFMENNLPLFRY